MDEPGLVDYVIAPLTWLERSKGWKRGGLVLLYLVTALIVGLLGWRELSLWRLPDIGDPFDLATFGTVDVPASANAMVLYNAAQRRLIAPDSMVYRVASSKSWNTTSWGSADPEVRRWVTDNQPALALWLEGTERPDSLFAQPRDLNSRTFLKAVFTLRDFANLAILEASRLEEDGDLAGAWRMYRASLRSSRHAGRHGGPMQRLLGHGILAACKVPVTRWIDDTRVAAEMLHRAIADVEACKTLTSPTSEMIRAEYYSSKSVLEQTQEWKGRRLDGPDGEGTWYNHISLVPASRHFFMREPERSLRVLKLITASHLAQCDRPPPVRAKVFDRKFGIYEIDSQTPRAVAAVDPGELATWAEHSAYSVVAGNLEGVLMRVDAEAAMLDTLLIRMAERAYELDHGKPPRTYNDLLGAYLKALPDGIEGVDHVSATSSPE